MKNFSFFNPTDLFLQSNKFLVFVIVIEEVVVELIKLDPLQS